MNDLPERIVYAYQVDKLSVQQIVKSFSVSQRHVQKTLDNAGISRRSINEAIRMHHRTKFGKKDFIIKENLTKEEMQLKIAGVMLYWGEGTKEWGTVTLANSDPRMVRIFLRFLRVVCGVVEERLRAVLHYYPDHDLKELLSFWSETTGIPPSQFNKPYMHLRRKTGTYRNPSTYGTISVSYSDVRLLQIICSWMVEYETLGISS